MSADVLCAFVLRAFVPSPGLSPACFLTHRATASIA